MKSHLSLDVEVYQLTIKDRGGAMAHVQDVVRRLHSVIHQQPHHVHQVLPGACQFGNKLFGVWSKNPEDKSFLYHTFGGEGGCDDCGRAVALRIVVE